MSAIVPLEQRSVLGMRIDAANYAEAAALMIAWARERESRYVCCANVHMVMEGHDSSAFQRVVNEADLVTADGMPLVWALRLLGIGHATRACGPVLTSSLLEAAGRHGLRVGFYGGRPDVLARLQKAARDRVPGLQMAYAWAPPFRPLTAEEDARAVTEIAECGTQILFVGLGCPKQEWWMAKHRGRIPAVMVGVGAAFDILGGTVRAAPGWMQAHGLEWTYRLWQEPRRLWRRYAWHNPRFATLFMLQLLRTQGRNALPS